MSTTTSAPGNRIVYVSGAAGQQISAEQHAEAAFELAVKLLVSARGSAIARARLIQRAELLLRGEIIEREVRR